MDPPLPPPPKEFVNTSKTTRTSPDPELYLLENKNAYRQLGRSLK